MASAHETTVREVYEAANRRDMDGILAGTHEDPVGMHGRGRVSGAELDAEIFHLAAMRDGLVVRIEGFTEREPAMRALEAT
jgi:ketosteroid isomerase-like protein